VSCCDTQVLIRSNLARSRHVTPHARDQRKQFWYPISEHVFLSAPLRNVTSQEGLGDVVAKRSLEKKWFWSAAGRVLWIVCVCHCVSVRLHAVDWFDCTKMGTASCFTMESISNWHDVVHRNALILNARVIISIGSLWRRKFQKA
jgi:hypothetical protein